MEGLEKAALILEECLKGQMRIDQIKNGRWNEASWGSIRKGMEAFRYTASHQGKHLVVIMNEAPKENSRNKSKAMPRPGHEDPEDGVIFLNNPVFKVSGFVPHGHQ